MHKTRILLLLSFFFLIQLFANASEHNGFDEICKIYTEVANSSMVNPAKSEYIFTNVKSRVTNNDALQAHSGIFTLDAAVRYSIFKQSAELSLKHSWDCEAMNKVLTAK